MEKKLKKEKVEAERVEATEDALSAATIDNNLKGRKGEEKENGEE